MPLTPRLLFVGAALLLAVFTLSACGYRMYPADPDGKVQASHSY